MKDKDIALPTLWKSEYNRGGIPSSIRKKPSFAIELLAKLLTTEKLPGLSGVDLGCGTGRNSLYLGDIGFDMTALDFVPDMINDLNKNSKELGLDDIVRGQVADLGNKWNLPKESYDFFIDTYCFKHIIDLVSRNNYKSELLKYSADGAIFLLTLASTEDGYYKLHAVRKEGDLQVILDPGNNIESILYNPEEVISFFSPEFQILGIRENIQTNVMHENEYERKGFEFTFKRVG